MVTVTKAQDVRKIKFKEIKMDLLATGEKSMITKVPFQKGEKLRVMKD